MLVSHFEYILFIHLHFHQFLQMSFFSNLYHQPLHNQKPDDQYPIERYIEQLY